MTDKENEAIEYWKDYISILDGNMEIASNYYAQILLNLIEKQQKIINLMIKDIISMSTYIDSMGIYTEFAKATEEYVYRSYEEETKWNEK